MRRPHPEPTASLLVVGEAAGFDLAGGLRGHLPDLRVRAAWGVTSALAEAERLRPAVVVIAGDARLDVEALCARLRSDARFGDPATLLLTDGARQEDWSAQALTVVDECLDGRMFTPAALADRVRTTLRRTAAMRDASPLTGLPGNAAIGTEIQRRLARDSGVALLYADLDHFKALNDAYGFLRGDAVIIAVADILRDVADRCRGAFVGHVGGDDFIVLTSPGDAEVVAREALDRFASVAADFYDHDDRVRGGLECTDRQGVVRFVPLVTLSIGIASTARRAIDDHRELVELATEMKRHAKTLEGNRYAVDRRGAAAAGATTVDSSRPPRRPATRRPAQRRTRRRLAHALSIAVLSLAMLLSTTAAMAGSSSPGDALWPVKLRVEAVQLWLARDADQQLRLRVEFASRRLAELTTLSAQDPSPELVERTADELDRLLDGLGGAFAAAGGGAGTPSWRSLERHFRVVLGQQTLLLADLRDGTCEAMAGRPAASQLCARLQLAADSAGRLLAGISEPEADDGSRIARQPTAQSDEVASRGWAAARRTGVAGQEQGASGTAEAADGDARGAGADAGPADRPAEATPSGGGTTPPPTAPPATNNSRARSAPETVVASGLSGHAATPSVPASSAAAARTPQGPAPTAPERRADQEAADHPPAPKPSAPRPTAPQPTAPKPSAPKPSAPRPTAPKPTAPRPTADKPPAPDSVGDAPAERSHDQRVAAPVEVPPPARQQPGPVERPQPERKPVGEAEPAPERVRPPEPTREADAQPQSEPEPGPAPERGSDTEPEAEPDPAGDTDPEPAPADDAGEPATGDEPRDAAPRGGGAQRREPGEARSTPAHGAAPGRDAGV